MLAERKKNLQCISFEGINAVEMSVIPQTVHILNGIPMKIPTSFFTETKKKGLKIHLEIKKKP